MKYQLVLQLPTTFSDNDHDKLIAFEETLLKGLGNLGDVDGHDIGSGEMNIFIATDDPQIAFEKIRFFLRTQQSFDDLKAAYREIKKDDYTILHPPHLKHFKVV